MAADARRVARLASGDDEDACLACPRALASRLLTTAYMASLSASSQETRARAAAVAIDVGSRHVELEIDGAVASLLGAATAALGCVQPRFKADGGTGAEHMALQNVQARSRMVLAFLLAQLGPWAAASGGGRGGVGAAGCPATPKPASPGFLLVLGASNVDEALRGYLTKYDCSSADINPIGGVSKADLRRFLRWAATPAGLGYPALAGVEAAPPTAELVPPTPGAPPQTDEADMGLTYAELGACGGLRTVGRCGPAAMCERLCGEWPGVEPAEVAAKARGRTGDFGWRGLEGFQVWAARRAGWTAGWTAPPSPLYPSHTPLHPTHYSVRSNTFGARTAPIGTRRRR